MIVIFVVERKLRKSYNLTYLNLSISDMLWAVYGACIEGPGTILYYLD